MRRAGLAACVLVLLAVAAVADARARTKRTGATRRISRASSPLGSRVRVSERRAQPVDELAGVDRSGQSGTYSSAHRRITRRALASSGANSWRTAGSASRSRASVPPQAAAEDRQLKLVHVHAEPALSEAELRRHIEAAGGEVERVHRSASRTLASARLPPAALELIASAAGVRSVRAPAPPKLRGAANPLRSGLEALSLEPWVPEKADGAGITIGVLSDSYDCLGGAARDVAAGVLPGAANPRGRTHPVRVVQEIADPSNCTDEGRAMLQLVHAVAPGAALCFASAFPDMLAFMANMEALAKPPCSADIVVDDVGFPDEPVYADAAVAESVSRLVAKGVTVVSAAGNDGGQTASFFVDASDEELPDVLKGEEGYLAWQVFDEESETPYYLKLWVEEQTDIWLQWNDPSDAPGAISMDLDLYLLKDGKVFDYSDDYNSDVGLPQESIGSVPAGEYLVAVALWDINTTFPFEDERQIFLYSTEPLSEEDWTSFEAPGPAASIWGHAADPGVLSVGSFKYYDVSRPAFYSSAGPAQLYFDAHARPYFPPQVRLVPTVSGVDCVDTSFFGDEDPERNDFPNFCGTSASAAHIAGLAAVLLQYAGGKGSLGPAALADVLARSTPGGPWDAQSGYGLVDGGRALEALLHASAFAAVQGQVAALEGMAGILRANGSAASKPVTQAQVQRLTESVSQVRGTLSGLQSRVGDLAKTAQAAKEEEDRQTGAVADLAKQLAALAQQVAEARAALSSHGHEGGGAGSTLAAIGAIIGIGVVSFAGYYAFQWFRRRRAQGPRPKNEPRQRGFELVGEGDLDEERAEEPA